MTGASAQDQARDLLTRTRRLLEGDESALARLDVAAARLDEPLRVALAGRIKAGKSTLINAFLGEQVAPTDTGECTKIVTWYLGGASPRIRVIPRTGEPVERPVHRVDGRLRLDTGGLAVGDVLRIEVTWPSPILDNLTLIDTPGLASLSEEVSASSTDALVPHGSASEVDAVVYLLRHLHASDAEFLSAFKEQQGMTNGPATTLGVLSRADEVGSGRLDAMLGAAKVADRYRNDPLVRALCIDVVPVAGLMAEGARTMRQAEFEALRELSGLPRREREQLLISADRFASTALEGAGSATSDIRVRLLERLGVFGIRLATVLIRDGFDTATALSEELVRRSGLDAVSRVLTVQFSGRATALKARTTLLTLSQELVGRAPESDGLRDEVESALRNTHEHREMRLLAELRAPHRPRLDADALGAAERVLGSCGTTSFDRLGVQRGLAPDVVRAEALGQLQTWRQIEARPANGQVEIRATRTVIRSLEGIVDQLDHAQAVDLTAEASGAERSV